MIQNLYSRLEMNFSKPKARLAMRTYSQNETWDDINKKREDDFMYDIFSCSLNSSQWDHSSIDESECTQKTDENHNQDLSH